jgi:hypothetical protein
MARHSIERARREARRRPLAAIRHTQQFNIFTEHTNIYIYIYISNSSKDSGGFLTTGFNGVADGAAQKLQTPVERRRRAAHCATQNSKPATREAIGATAHFVEHLASTMGTAQIERSTRCGGNPGPLFWIGTAAQRSWTPRLLQRAACCAGRRWSSLRDEGAR